VTNLGPGDVSSAVVTDDFDPLVRDIANVTWTCAAGAGAGPATSCPPNGAGANLVSGVDLSVEAGDTVSFSADAAVFATASGLLSNSACIESPAAVTDPVPANDSATDVDGIPGACGHAEDLDLAGLFIEYVESFIACSSKSGGAGLEVDSAGELTLRAGVSIAIRNGFSVWPGALINVELDPTLAPP